MGLIDSFMSGAAADNTPAPAPKTPDVNPIYSGLISRGFSPVQAAALAGNMQQESSFNPNAVNTEEDAHGLLQWRLDRWQALQDFAKANNGSPTDLNTQLDFIRHEMNGAEKKAGSAFMAATDLPSANAALKGYIRYGDKSQDARLAYAQPFLTGQQPAMATPVTAPVAQAPFRPAVAPQAAPIFAPQPQPQQQPQQQAPDTGIEMPQIAPMQMPPIFVAPRKPVDLSKLRMAFKAPTFARG